jgi:hypothetical protein
VILLEQLQHFLAGGVQQFSDFVDPDCGQNGFPLSRFVSLRVRRLWQVCRRLDDFLGRLD